MGSWEMLFWKGSVCQLLRRQSEAMLYVTWDPGVGEPDVADSLMGLPVVVLR
jgi:hypothetical protein